MRLSATTAVVLGVLIAAVAAFIGFAIGKGGNDGNPVGPLHYANSEQMPLTVQNGNVIATCFVEKKPCAMDLYLTTTVLPASAPKPITCKSLDLASTVGCYSFDSPTTSVNDTKPVNLSGTIVLTPLSQNHGSARRGTPKP
jgi:hypothetical protein